MYSPPLGQVSKGNSTGNIQNKLLKSKLYSFFTFKE